jgi:hypothetical protein
MERLGEKSGRSFLFSKRIGTFTTPEVEIVYTIDFVYAGFFINHLT